MPIATWFDVASEHIWSFAIGVVIGFVLTNRYRITKRKEDE